MPVDLDSRDFRARPRALQPYRRTDAFLLRKGLLDFEGARLVYARRGFQDRSVSLCRRFPGAFAIKIRRPSPARVLRAAGPGFRRSLAANSPGREPGLVRRGPSRERGRPQHTRNGPAIHSRGDARKSPRDATSAAQAGVGFHDRHSGRGRRFRTRSRALCPPLQRTSRRDEPGNGAMGSVSPRNGRPGLGRFSQGQHFGQTVGAVLANEPPRFRGLDRQGETAAAAASTPSDGLWGIPQRRYGASFDQVADPGALQTALGRGRVSRLPAHRRCRASLSARCGGRCRCIGRLVPGTTAAHHDSAGERRLLGYRGYPCAAKSVAAARLHRQARE